MWLSILHPLGVFCQISPFFWCWGLHLDLAWCGGGSEWVCTSTSTGSTLHRWNMVGNETWWNLKLRPKYDFQRTRALDGLAKSRLSGWHLEALPMKAPEALGVGRLDVGWRNIFRRSFGHGMMHWKVFEMMHFWWDCADTRLEQKGWLHSLGVWAYCNVCTRDLRAMHNSIWEGSQKRQAMSTDLTVVVPQILWQRKVHLSFNKMHYHIADLETSGSVTIVQWKLVENMTWVQVA